MSTGPRPSARANAGPTPPTDAVTGCRHLGITDDIDSAALYPRSDHLCRVPNAPTPSIDWQNEYCLTCKHAMCRYFEPQLLLIPAVNRTAIRPETLNDAKVPVMHPWHRVSRRDLVASVVVLVALLLVGIAALATAGSGGATTTASVSTRSGGRAVVFGSPAEEAGSKSTDHDATAAVVFPTTAGDASGQATPTATREPSITLPIAPTGTLGIAGDPVTPTPTPEPPTPTAEPTQELPTATETETELPTPEPLPTEIPVDDPEPPPLPPPPTATPTPFPTLTPTVPAAPTATPSPIPQPTSTPTQPAIWTPLPTPAS